MTECIFGWGKQHGTMRLDGGLQSGSINLTLPESGRYPPTGSVYDLTTS